MSWQEERNFSHLCSGVGNELNENVDSQKKCRGTKNEIFYSSVAESEVSWKRTSRVGPIRGFFARRNLKFQRRFAWFR